MRAKEVRYCFPRATVFYTRNHNKTNINPSTLKPFPWFVSVHFKGERKTFWADKAPNQARALRYLKAAKIEILTMKA